MTDLDPLRVMSIGDIRRALEVSPGVLAGMDKRNELPRPFTLTPRGTRLWLASDVRSWLAGMPVDRSPLVRVELAQVPRMTEADDLEGDNERDEQRYAPRRSWRSADDFEAERRDLGELERIVHGWVTGSFGMLKNDISIVAQI
ncbi:helix-turn-helix transcriptional regulator [Paraburkholderia phymatum]|uniref:Helix-turn-helix transcriptional regulator n=1 Tax=Paraburkholderia phymatum TaxID=148447 RepID=A0ACC6U5B0_9BURK